MNYTELIEKNYAKATKGIKEEWFVKPDDRWYEYVISLPIQLRTCYLTVIFHNQIFNGGFHQYFVNGYGQFARETVNALKGIGCIKKAQLLEEAFKIVNFDNYSDKIFRKLLLEKKILQLFSQDDLFDPLDNLDNAYYEIENEDVEDLLGNYLKVIEE